MILLILEGGSAYLLALLQTPPSSQAEIVFLSSGLWHSVLFYLELKFLSVWASSLQFRDAQKTEVLPYPHGSFCHSPV